MVGVVSAAGLVGFLSEPDTDLQIFALKAANESISLLWTELAGAIGQMYVYVSAAHSFNPPLDCRHSSVSRLLNTIAFRCDLTMGFKC